MRTKVTPEEHATAHARLHALLPSHPYAPASTPTPTAPPLIPKPPPGERAPAADDDKTAGLPRHIHLGGLRAVLAEHAPRLAPPRAKVVLLAVLGLAAVLAAALYAWRSQPSAEPLPPPPTTAPALPTPPTPQPTAPSLIVHVTGKVRRPGVITLPAGSRVTDAVAAAGGVKKGATTGPLNLARRLIDGEQIVVGAPHTAAAQPPLTADSPPGAPINLNTATAEQLDTLPGVGEVLARRIVDYRESHGGFRDVAQLQDVSGIGDSKYADLKDKVTV
ncbi:competence protein ComEA [Thermocatellispora tengchongensis]|uniref:Competence protein ComEA n=1 Tax=Thermocatellispora tengchongensis TaxID=1073253 RepID=A0A840P275_9ACTN|nr:ComEA family DNA-binding protein [Thermocatellispora tengchongensis]MBB5133089.1 competence protein ComEA [Thermocatellispora tengchongensis]